VTPQELRREREQYARDVLDRYRRSPETAGHVRANDRRLALWLYDRNVPLSVVEDAILLATCRRTFRAPEGPPLNPVRSLHYLLPVIQELVQWPPDPDYLRYLRRRLNAFLAGASPARTHD
jgi:hypothetical protein